MERTLERSERHSEGVMQFQWALIEAMKDSHKTQTRRVKRPGECVRYAHRGRQFIESSYHAFDAPAGEYVVPTVVIFHNYTVRNRIKWQVGRRYAINPPPGPEDKGRMGKAVGSYECVGLREERLQDISSSDAIVDAALLYSPVYTWMTHAVPGFFSDPYGAFINLWDSIAKKGERFADNPTVWVIEMGEFEWEEE